MMGKDKDKGQIHNYLKNFGGKYYIDVNTVVLLKIRYRKQTNITLHI